MVMRLKRIVWDWNGTLFNDVDLCFECINRLMVSHGLSALKNIDQYRNVFGFPIHDYYRKVGFDFSKVSFDSLAKEYMEDYQEKSYACSLQVDALETLRQANAYGISQCVLSASKKNNLVKQINQYDISDYLDSIWGIENIYASSKLKLAHAYKATCAKDDDIWFVGDSMHDFEVARSVNANCVLVTTGHQSKNRLLSCNVPLMDNLMDSLEYIWNK